MPPPLRPSRDNLRADAAPQTPTPDSPHRRTLSSEATPRPSPALRTAVAQAAAAAPTSSGLVPPRAQPGSIPPASPAKPSPSKAQALSTAARTYDSKMITREMQRLGSALAPALLSSAAAAASTLSLPQALPTLGGSSTSPVPPLEPWHALHSHLIPLFNRQPLRCAVEDLNTLARKHVAAAVSASPSKALSALEADVSELFTLGMLTLDARLRAGPEETLPARIVEQWRYFWDRILPYLEAALLPMQTDALLAGLQRRKGTPGLDVRAVALRLFRDKLVVPVAKPLAAAIIQPRVPWSEMDRKRLQQMLLVLTSYTRAPPPARSLTEPAPPPSAGDQALSALLRALRSPQLDQLSSSRPAVRAPSFLSSKLPRDRRARIAGRGNVDFALAGVERSMDRAFLDALRSPEPDGAPRGGWGLGAGDEGTPHPDEEEDEFEWENAQGVGQAHKADARS